MGKLRYILFYATFIMIVTQLSSMAGMTLISGDVRFSPPSPPANILEVPGWFVGNIVYFFKLMTVSTPFFYLGIFIIILVIGLLWIIIETIAEAIP